MRRDMKGEGQARSRRAVGWGRVDKCLHRNPLLIVPESAHKGPVCQRMLQRMFIRATHTHAYPRTHLYV